MQYMSMKGIGEGEPIPCAAIVTMAHDDDCVNLKVFPDESLDVDGEFSAGELEEGLARRTSVIRGDQAGNWRPIPDT